MSLESKVQKAIQSMPGWVKFKALPLAGATAGALLGTTLGHDYFAQEPFHSNQLLTTTLSCTFAAAGGLFTHMKMADWSFPSPKKRRSNKSKKAKTGDFLRKHAWKSSIPLVGVSAYFEMTNHSPMHPLQPVGWTLFPFVLHGCAQYLSMVLSDNFSTSTLRKRAMLELGRDVEIEDSRGVLLEKTKNALRTGKWAEGIEKAARASVTPPSGFDELLQLQRNSSLISGIYAARRKMKKHPENVGYPIQLVTLDRLLGADDWAQRDFQEALTHHPEHRATLLFLDGLYKLYNDDPQASDILKEALMSGLQKEMQVQNKLGKRTYRLQMPEGFPHEMIIFAEGSKESLEAEIRINESLKQHLRDEGIQKYRMMDMLNGVLSLEGKYYSARMYVGREPIREALTRDPNIMVEIAANHGTLHRISEFEQRNQDVQRSIENRVAGLPETVDRQALLEGLTILTRYIGDDYVFDIDGHIDNVILDEEGNVINIDKEDRGYCPDFFDLAKLIEQGNTVAADDHGMRLAVCQAYLESRQKNLSIDQAMQRLYASAQIKGVSFLQHVLSLTEDPSFVKPAQVWINNLEQQMGDLLEHISASREERAHLLGPYKNALSQLREITSTSSTN